MKIVDVSDIFFRIFNHFCWHFYDERDQFTSFVIETKIIDPSKICTNNNINLLIIKLGNNKFIS